ncbi:hypothetical protein PA598K_05193 [Paenibacillus sp. 598K]|uniref:hypothetical protein n=1 Tax=Paenibacillus sp. 598K TaxID=1117987 RepID=UPI000FFA5240|nr:hypothetical protein [Paenibacillus sp. 598K]GBF76708.1 hypothetical protein PA598K_05193 [Paenibacillus sp. 598K]
MEKTAERRAGELQVEGLTAATLQRLADQGAALEIGHPLAIYPVPAGHLDLSGVSGLLGQAEAKDIQVNIEIARASEALIASSCARATEAGYEMLVDPVALDLTFGHDGQTVRSELLSGYAAKYIALPEGIDPKGPRAQPDRPQSGDDARRGDGAHLELAQDDKAD